MAVAASSGGPPFTSVSDTGDVFSSGIFGPTISGVGPCAATPVGGTAPYIYSWSKVSGGAITVDSPSASSTTFSVTGMAGGENRNALFKCTVTDAFGVVKATRNITVDITAA